MRKPRKRGKKRAAVKLSQMCTVCKETAVRLVANVRPRTCVECVVWPPEPGEQRGKKPERKKGKRR